MEVSRLGMIMNGNLGRRNSRSKTFTSLKRPVKDRAFSIKRYRPNKDKLFKLSKKFALRKVPITG